jgi:hypothetical protein
MILWKCIDILSEGIASYSRYKRYIKWRTEICRKDLYGLHSRRLDHEERCSMLVARPQLDYTASHSLRQHCPNITRLN